MPSLITILRTVHDPRDCNARHDLAAILFLALAGTLCGAKSCVDIADFAEANAEDLAAIVPLPHGAPSHDTFSRVFRLLDPAELDTAFRCFMESLRDSLGLGAPRGVVAVDAKSLRRSYERGRAHMPPLMVSVWDTQTRLSIGARPRARQRRGQGEARPAQGPRAQGLHCNGRRAARECRNGLRRARRQGARLPRLKGNRGLLHGTVEAAEPGLVLP
jgi:hypothetical protein